MHDFAMTKQYLVFMDGSLHFDLAQMVQGKLPFASNTTVPSRIGLMRKNAPEQGVAHWFEVPPFFAFHTVHAWEEDKDTVILVVIRCGAAWLRLLALLLACAAASRSPVDAFVYL